MRGKALARLLDTLGRPTVNTLLAEWNGSELTADGTAIVYHDRREGTGQWRYPLGEFFAWLFSDQPLNANIYSQDDDWVRLIARARAVLMV
jgi:hypothetical protein